MLMQKWTSVLILVFSLFLMAPLSHAQGVVPVTERAVETNSADQHETAIAIDPSTSTLVIGWNDFRAEPDNIPIHAGYGFSLNGGSSWLRQVLTEERTPTLPNHKGGFDPSFVIDQNGNAYYCYVLRDLKRPNQGGTRHIFVSKTDDFGGSWSHTEVFGGINDKPYIAVDNTGGGDGNLYVSWVRPSIDAIYFGRSTDGGSSFVNIRQIASASGASAPTLSKISNSAQ